MMGPVVVVLIEEFCKTNPSFTRAFVVVYVDLLVLYCTPEPFCEDIVHGPAAAVHANSNLVVEQYLGVSLAGKLAALVTVCDLRLASFQCPS